MIIQTIKTACNDLVRQHVVLISGALGSIGLLAVFFFLQWLSASILALPSKWLWVSLAPVVIALLGGGYIGRLEASNKGIVLETKRVKPTKPPTEKKELPSVDAKAPLPADYLFINHTSFLRPQMQEQFQRLTGVPLPHYDIRVIVDSYYHGALDQIERVEYVLHEAYPHPIQIRTRKEDHFLLKELANGEYVLLAKIFLKTRDEILVLQRYITLWREGPRFDDMDRQDIAPDLK